MEGDTAHVTLTQYACVPHPSNRKYQQWRKTIWMPKCGKRKGRCSGILPVGSLVANERVARVQGAREPL